MCCGCVSRQRLGCNRKGYHRRIVFSLGIIEMYLGRRSCSETAYWCWHRISEQCIGINDDIFANNTNIANDEIGEDSDSHSNHDTLEIPAVPNAEKQHKSVNESSTNTNDLPGYSDDAIEESLTDNNFDISPPKLQQVEDNILSSPRSDLLEEDLLPLPPPTDQQELADLVSIPSLISGKVDSENNANVMFISSSNNWPVLKSSLGLFNNYHKY